MQRHYLFPPVCFLLSVGAMICLAVFIPGKTIISFPWNLLGVLPFVTGAAITVLVDRAFRRDIDAGGEPEGTGSLITTGMFRYSRNPMYLGYLLMLGGLGVSLGALTPLLVIPLFLFILQAICIAVEERTLEERFGETWSRYRREVRRWL